MRQLLLLVTAGLWLGCGPAIAVDDAGVDPRLNRDEPDASVLDAGALPDAGEDDAGEPDAGEVDAGEVDAGTPDAGEPDAGDFDAGMIDAGAVDSGVPDAGLPDAGRPDAGMPDAGIVVPTTALLRPNNPLPCADPAVVSETGAGQIFYVYCTSMSHVWRTTNWVTFTDVRSSVTFDVSAMSANGKLLGSWWAPGIIYAPAIQKYVMWVSVPDAQGTNNSGWDTRSIAVLTADSPAGQWTFRALAIDATVGQQFIDPFLFRDHDGGRYVYWKQYGGGVNSSIMGARVDATWAQLVAGSSLEIMNGYGGVGTWEDNVRENPAVSYDAATDRHHLIFSGGHWFDDSYATGHAISSCGPLCPAAQTGGWRMRDSGDRNILQVVRSLGNANFTNGGPGGAEFLDGSAQDIIYAAAARSASGLSTRYLMRDRVEWLNLSPFVDTAGHEPLGY